MFKTCSATHPDMPNFDDTSRSRKLHLTMDEKHTLCKMLVGEMMEPIPYQRIASRGICKNCRGLEAKYEQRAKMPSATSSAGSWRTPHDQTITTR